jgi:hypothetical protein
MLGGGFRKPPVKERNQLPPTGFSLSATAKQSMPPQQNNTMPKARQHRQVSRNCMISVVAQHHRSQPFAGGTHRLVHPLAQLQLNPLETRSHSLGHGPPRHLELSVLASSTDVRQSQKIERFGWSLPSIFPTLFGKPAELNQPRFLRMQFQPKSSQPLRQCCTETFRIFPELKRKNHIIGIADNEHLTSRFLSPLVRPEIQRIVQVDVRQQGRNDSPYAKDNLTFERILKYR